jgi:D-amino peptidase
MNITLRKFRFVYYLLFFSITCAVPVNAQTTSSGSLSVYIFADMEGCSGLTNRDQLMQEGNLRMAGDMNACIAACFDGGATRVTVRDGHSGGKNVDPQLIDKRAVLVQGATPEARFKGIEGCEAVILLGYHARALTPAAIMAHSYSSATIQSMYLNGKAVGEIGVDAAIASEHQVPVVMVSGDDKACHEADEWIPGVVTCQVKTATSALSGNCLPLDEAHALIASKTKEALAKRNSIAFIRVQYPVTLRWDYIPEGTPRVYAPDFKPFPDPVFRELTSGSVEKLLLGKP